MTPKVDPKVDYAFKYMVGRDETRPILVSVVDSVLSPGSGRRLQHLDLINPFNPKESLDDKLSILDIKARDQAGWQFNVEMQMLAHRSFAKRGVFYLTRFHSQQLHEGQDYLELKPTISITFLNDVLFPDVPDYHLKFRLLEERHHFPFVGDLELHLLELPKFTKTAAELTSELDIWLYFLRHAEKMDTEALPPAMQQPLVMRAMEELMKFSQDEVERERYESRRKAQMDYDSGLKGARLDGLDEGIEIGVKKGIEKGIEKGRQEGEKNGKIEVIHLCERLLNRSRTSSEQLAVLSLAELTRLADELQNQVSTPR